MMVTAQTAMRRVRKSECVTCCTVPGRLVTASGTPERALAPVIRVA